MSFSACSDWLWIKPKRPSLSKHRGCVQRLRSFNFHLHLYFPPFNARVYKIVSARIKSTQQKLETLNRELRLLQWISHTTVQNKCLFAKAKKLRLLRNQWLICIQDWSENISSFGEILHFAYRLKAKEKKKDMLRQKEGHCIVGVTLYKCLFFTQQLQIDRHKQSSIRGKNWRSATSSSSRELTAHSWNPSDFQTGFSPSYMTYCLSWSWHWQSAVVAAKSPLTVCSPTIIPLFSSND